MNEIINAITDGIFAFFVTLGSIPIIRCPKGTAAEFIAEVIILYFETYHLRFFIKKIQIQKKLDKKIRDNLRDSRNNHFTNDHQLNTSLTFQRPLLILLDRNFDLATPLHHTWTYQALMHDLLDLKMNRVDIAKVLANPELNIKSEAARSYDLLNSDKFWRQHKGDPFPIVAESIRDELEKYKVSEATFKNLKQTMNDESGQDGNSEIDFLSNTNKLTSAITSLPELLETKRLLDMHTNISTALLDHIKNRKLDNYFETEEKLMNKVSIEKSIMEIINDPESGTTEDKMRLFLIYYLCSSNNLSSAELDQYLLQLQSVGCDIECVKFIKRYKSIQKMNYPNSYSNVDSSTVNKFSNLLSKSSKFVMDGVKNLVLKQYKLPVTKIADNLMDLKSSPDIDDYRYFDPKLIKNDNIKIKTPFNDAVVFIIGGGNYIEYQNLLDNAKLKSTATNSKRVVYGCTDFMNPASLIQQINKLGHEIA
jgi:sec1 family domain-containing protein 1